MLRIELDDLSRDRVLSLLEEHLRNMYMLSPPEQVFAFAWNSVFMSLRLA
jgi:putative acetyltransferase